MLKETKRANTSVITKKSTATNVFIRLFDKSKRSNDVNGDKEFHGTLVSALFGRPG